MGIFSKFVAKLKGQSTADPLVWKVLEEELLAADLGPILTTEILKSAQGLKGDDALSSLTQILNSHLSAKPRALSDAGTVGVVLVVGVNGTGKTTSAAKLANLLKSSGSSVMLAAGDTFRAAAVDQLQTWGARIGVPVISGKDGAEPAAVAFDAVKQAVEMKADIVIIDTAGRLHTKVNLMTELTKIKRVIQKFIPEAPHEVMLVLDGSTGQNALEQAKQFTATTEVTALSITKLDGTAKGGVVLAIANQFKIPVKYIGVGEKIDDLIIFDKHEFVDSLFKGVTNS